MCPKFQVYKDAADKFRFRLRADNNKIVAIGEAYEQHASCINGINSIQRNCNSEIEDLTIEDRKVSNPKYQIFKDAGEEFRFHLKASNGEIIAESQGYKAKDDCLRGIEVVRSSCSAEIEDLSASPKLSEVETGAALTKTTSGSLVQNMSSELLKNEPSKIRSQTMPDRSRIVFVGNKTPMDYVLAIITGFSANNAKELTLKARGQAIATAVDAAEIARNRFLKDLKVGKIMIGTEAMPPREGETRARMVSTIEIMLTKE